MGLFAKKLNDHHSTESNGMQSQGSWWQNPLSTKNRRSLKLILRSDLESVQLGLDNLHHSIEEQNSLNADTLLSIKKVEQLGSQNIERTETVIEKTKISNQCIDDSKNTMSRLNNAAEEINRINADFKATISSLTERQMQISQSFRNIQKKTDVIHDIVFQTKLLSFNASIEAARAGNAGVGFAVVADEMRKLAEESKKSASEITDVVSKSVKDIERLTNEFRTYIDSILGEQEKVAKENRAAVQNIATSLESIETSSQTTRHEAEYLKALITEQAETLQSIKSLVEKGMVFMQNAKELYTTSTRAIAKTLTLLFPLRIKSNKPKLQHNETEPTSHKPEPEESRTNLAEQEQQKNSPNLDEFKRRLENAYSFC